MDDMEDEEETGDQPTAAHGLSDEEPDDEEADTGASPLLPSDVSSKLVKTNLSKELVVRITEAIYTTSEAKLRELVDQAGVLAGIPKNLLHPIPKFEGKLEQYISPEGRKVESRLYKMQNDLWQLLQPNIRAFERMRVLTSKQKPEVVKLLHVALQGHCVMIGDIVPDREELTLCITPKGMWI
jgi:hypothetical protein